MGMTSFVRSSYDSLWLNTGFTGVLRSHRRRGLAHALKTIAISQMRQRGIRCIRAMNEENNPIWLLNQKLGFVARTAVLAYEKQF